MLAFINDGYDLFSTYQIGQLEVAAELSTGFACTSFSDEQLLETA